MLTSSTLLFFRSKDGSRLITGDWAYTTRVWDIGSSSVVVNLNGHAGTISLQRVMYACDAAQRRSALPAPLRLPPNG